MNDKADISAAREHSIGSRRTRVHVIVCHDLDSKSHSLSEMFRYAEKVGEQALAIITHQLADDIIADADLLIRELRGIKAFAERQKAKLPTPFRD